MGEAAALTAALSWAFASTAVASLSGRLPAVGLSALQTSFASVVLISAMVLSGQLDDLLRADVITLLAVAGSGVVGFAIGEPVYVRALAIVGMQRTYPVTIGLFILFTTAGGVLILGERLTLGLVAGGSVILAGAYLIVSSRERTSPQAGHPPPSPGVGGWGRPGTALAPIAVRRTFRDFEGYALLVTVPILWTVASLWVAGARGDLGAVPLAGLRVPVGAFLLMAFVSMARPQELRTVVARRRDVLTIAGASLAGISAGSLLYVYALIEAGAARSAILSASSPLFAIPLAVIFLHEQLTPQILLGTTLSVTGIIIVVTF
ncbi:MAG: DMT family transporter [Chloroflexi bacterium]|nr:DMT family transporter [Chloroflexota bacterium]